MAGFLSQVGALARRYGPTALRLAQREGPRALRAIQSSRSGSTGTGRPTTTRSRPSVQRARRLEYSPQLDGRADPGEVVWTWVTYEEDASQGKDRPVLVVGREGDTLLGLMLSSNARRGDQAGWLALGTGPWDAERRPSFLRLDRVLDVPEAGIRREGAVLDRARFDTVAERLRRDYGWS
ncbi:type II toxin-antitoxin system PemK/MazF family toxin [Rhodococcus aerolatus]